MDKMRTGLSCGNRRKRKQTARSGDHSEAEETTWNSHPSGVPFPFFQRLRSARIQSVSTTTCQHCMITFTCNSNLQIYLHVFGKKSCFFFKKDPIFFIIFFLNLEKEIFQLLGCEWAAADPC